MLFTNWPTGEYSLLAASEEDFLRNKQEINALCFHWKVFGFFYGYFCLVYLVFCTCRACLPCESWCAAGDVRAGWTCVDIFHICRAWCQGGSSCVGRGRSCWRRTCYSGCICRVWVLSYGLGCGAAGPPWSRNPTNMKLFKLWAYD